MRLLNFAEADGLKPKRVALTKGGEYHSPCPGCGGRDRFIIWDKTERYFCRQCQKKGDSIQYLRDFRSLSYPEACAIVGVVPREKSINKKDRSFIRKEIFQPLSVEPPSLAWQLKAEEFVLFCHQQLMSTPSAQERFVQRGFTLEGMRLFRLGWNPKTIWMTRTDWGLHAAKGRKQWLPQGLVIPSFKPLTRELIKLKIRRADWEENDELPKYVEVSGSMQSPSVYGEDLSKPIVVLESELDAMLIQQFASDICRSMALGGASKRPDAVCHDLLKGASMLLCAFDLDKAGAVALRWWRKIYPKIKLWMPPVGKSPGDACKLGIDLRKWIQLGLNQ